MLELDPENADAVCCVAAAERGEASTSPPAPSSTHVESHLEAAAPTAPPHPEHFAGDRRHLGDGGTKRVFLVRDTRLDREVALALVHTVAVGQRCPSQLGGPHARPRVRTATRDQSRRV